MRRETGWKTLKFVGDAICLSGLAGSKLKCDYLGKYYELINPVITETSGKVVDYEGCLSLPNCIGKVKRYQKIKVKYQNRFGDFLEVEPENELAKCFQHEIDHLSGILYIDRMTEEYVFNNATHEKIPVQQLLELSKSEIQSKK